MSNISRIRSLALELSRPPASILILISLLTWGYLMISSGELNSGAVGSHHMMNGAMHHHHMEHSQSLLSKVLTLHWVLMLISMMLPLHADAIINIWMKNFPKKRYLSIISFLLGYILIWSFVGVVSYAVMEYLKILTLGNEGISLFVIIGFTIIWQASPWKQRSLNRCAFIPVIRPFGVKAYIDSFKYGIQKASWCVGSCWALMLLSLFFMEKTMWIMPVFTVIMFMEQILPLRKEKWHWPFNPLVWR